MFAGKTRRVALSVVVTSVCFSCAALGAGAASNDPAVDETTTATADTATPSDPGPAAPAPADPAPAGPAPADAAPANPAPADPAPADPGPAEPAPADPAPATEPAPADPAPDTALPPAGESANAAPDPPTTTAEADSTGADASPPPPEPTTPSSDPAPASAEAADPAHATAGVGSASAGGAATSAPARSPSPPPVEPRELTPSRRGSEAAAPHAPVLPAPAFFPALPFDLQAWLNDNPASPLGATAVAIAEHYVGVPYVWGGSEPTTGFDCSGLTMYVYAQLGIALPHYAAAQFAAFPKLDPSQLEPGDLVFFEPQADGPGHVAIYAGDDRIIEAPHAGAAVWIGSLSGDAAALGFLGAVRPYGPAQADAARTLAAVEPPVSGGGGGATFLV